jgi:hypothetical protein
MKVVGVDTTMTEGDSAKNQKRLEALFHENGWDASTVLFRATLAEHLSPLGEDGVFEITGNPDPSEAVTDIYGAGHGTLALHVGVGLAFAEQADNSWVEPDRRLVAISPDELRALGGLIYPVESVVTEKVWYLTFPGGTARVRAVEAAEKA